MDIRIVKAVPERKEDYYEIMRESNLYTHYGDTLFMFVDDALVKGTLYIAEKSDGEAVGLADCRWKGMFDYYPYLALLGVKKQYRGMGVGTELLKAYEIICRSLGAEKIFLCVDAFNPRAKRLYISEGYRKYGFIPGLFKDSCDENIMMKILK